MDQENEDSIIIFKNTLVELLKDISYLGVTIQKKSNNNLSKINKTSESDINSLETVGKGLISILKGVRDNVVAITNTLEENIKKLDKGRHEELFVELSSKLLEYKVGNITQTANSECISPALCHTSTQTNSFYENNGDELQPKNKNKEINLMEKVEGNEKIKEEPIDDCTNRVCPNVELLARGSLSLLKRPERTDTQDTDDCWVDSLVRSPTALDLWNKEYRGDKIDATDEYLDQIKKEEEEDDQSDKEMVNLNVDGSKYDSDDIFVDGRTPEEEKPDVPSDEKDNIKNEIDVPSDEKEGLTSEIDTSVKQNQSFVVEEHELPEVQVDTAPTTKNSKDDSINTESSSITDKSNVQPENNVNKEASTNLDINKEAISPKPNPIIDYDNPTPGCSKSDINICSSTSRMHSEGDDILKPGNVGEQVKQKSVDPDLIGTENAEFLTESLRQINCSQTTDEIEPDCCESTKLDMPEDIYVSVYSVETVKIRSDSDESLSSQGSDQSEYNKEIPLIPNKSVNNCESTDDLHDNTVDVINESLPSNDEKDSIQTVPRSDISNCRESEISVSNSKNITPNSYHLSVGSDLENKIPGSFDDRSNGEDIKPSNDLNKNPQTNDCESMIQEETRQDDDNSCDPHVASRIDDQNVITCDTRNSSRLISDDGYIIREQQTKVDNITALNENEIDSCGIRDKTETNINNNDIETQQDTGQVHHKNVYNEDEKHLSFAAERDSVSNKSHSDADDTNNPKPDSKSVTNEKVEPGVSMGQLDGTLTQQSDELSQIQPDKQVDLIDESDVPQSDSLEIVTCSKIESSKLDTVSSGKEKTSTENDIPLTQMISTIEKNFDLPIDNIVRPLLQATACINTETDSRERTDALPSNLKGDDPVGAEIHTDTLQNSQHDKDSGLLCNGGDNEQMQEIVQLTQNSDDSAKENCTKEMEAESGITLSSDTLETNTNVAIVPRVSITESTKNSSDANLHTSSDKNELGKNNGTLDADKIQNNIYDKDNMSNLGNIEPESSSETDVSVSNVLVPVLGEQLQSNDETTNKDDIEPMVKVDSDEEDASSSKSFEFDINACLTEIDFISGSEKIVSKEKDDKKQTEDIIEVLEELLSKENKDDNQNKTVGTKNETIILTEDYSKKDKEEKDIDNCQSTDQLDKEEVHDEIQTGKEELYSCKEEKDRDSSIIANKISENMPNYPGDIQPGIKETIEIISDSDDDVHLDVTMEEIISAGSSINIECISDQEDIDKIQEIQEIVPIEPENTEEKLTFGGDKGDGLADELLELLREVEVHSELNNSGDKATSKSDKVESERADEIYKVLQEENDSDISDEDSSDEDVNLSLSDIEWIDEDDSTSSKSIEEANTEEAQNQELSEKLNIRECYVALERLEINEYEVIKVNKRLNDSIDRLCDISNLLRKRKFTHALGLSKCRRKRRKTIQGTSDLKSDYESFSDFTDSETEEDKSYIDLFSTTLPATQEQKLDDMLANEICIGFKGNTSDESSDYGSDGSHKKSAKKKKKDKCEDSKHSDSDKKEKGSKEELKRKAWQNDPLLRGKLTSSESDIDSSTSDSEKSRKRRNFLKSKYEHDTDFYIISDSPDTDSDDSIKRKQYKILMKEKIISPIKKNIPTSDSDSTDSEIEFVPQQKTPDKNLSGDDMGPSSSQKGRRNIRALMSDENLAEATQRANKEEQERIERLEDRHRIKESFSQASQLEYEEDLILDVEVATGKPTIKVHPGLTKKLKPHQKSGIQFMWDSCYESVERLKDDEGSGCILAHCMGLGKTFQVLALIHTLFTHEITNAKHVLVVCPLSTVNNWKKEVKIIFKDIPEEKFNVLTIADKKETSNKYNIVKKWSLKRKCVLVLGYEGFETLTNEFKLDKGGRNLRERMLEALVDPGPDLVICDEGHLLRNKKALKTLALNRIRTKRRIVLTGTPLQNNLLEYYHMVQFVKPNLLGTMKEFKTNFVNPITNGQYEDSTKDDIKLMMKRTHVLHKLLKKSIQRVEDTELKIYLPKIVDYAIFIQLHKVQVEMYNKFSELVKTNSADTNKRGFLSDFVVFQYIGTHPYLLSVIDEMKNKRIKEKDLITNEQEDNPICNIDGWWKAKVPEDAAENIEYGNKLMVVKSILEECEEIEDKVLLFSQSLGELDIIEHFLKKVGTAKCPSWKKKIDYFRMDGTVCPEYRSTICDLFNDKDNKKIRLLLMSTKVGGLGLNLTAANRVIIMTVNWNPSFDTQSVFRVYRFGQEKAVFVYRLISLDTMEEKVYQRTVTKLAIAHRVVDKHQITRHYKSMDLQELYSCRPKSDSERTMMPNLPEDLILGKLILKLPCIFKYHEHQALLANRPEDNLNDQELSAAWDEFKKIKDAATVAAPQIALQPGSPSAPTFEMAYNLTRPTQLAANKTATRKEIDENGLPQYYIPKANQKNVVSSNSLASRNLSNKYLSGTNTCIKPNVPPDIVSLENIVERPNMIPLPLSNSNSIAEQDPLYIPEKQSGKPINTYSKMLKHLKEKQQLLKTPKSTSVFLENNLPKTKFSRIANNSSSIVIDDDESGKRLTEHNLNFFENNTPSIAKSKKRRYDEMSHYDRSEIHKKMKEQFNTASNILNESQNSINLDDDDDDVTVITDTTSDSGSLSTDIIANLGLSGITIHKVKKNSHTNNSIITLD